MSDEDIAELRAILDALPDRARASRSWSPTTCEFHQRIAAGSGNAVLCSLIDSLSGPTTRARIWRGLTQEGALEKTREQHAAIFDAIAARQAGGGQGLGHRPHRGRRGVAPPHALRPASS